MHPTTRAREAVWLGDRSEARTDLEVGRPTAQRATGVGITGYTYLCPYPALAQIQRQAHTSRLGRDHQFPRPTWPAV